MQLLVRQDAHPGLISRLVILAAGASSIASLLFYFYGILEMRYGVPLLIGPSIAALILLCFLSDRDPHRVKPIVLSGLAAGAVATFVYDLVRVPIAWSGVPIFKAISYFGTVVLQVPSPTAASEFVGWLYHLSNGVGFALMYVALFPRPRWWTAVLWGLALEGAMLLTPYAEVFGYRLSRQFLAITIGAHVVYGLGLFLGLKLLQKGTTAQSLSATRRPSLWLVGSMMGIAAIATDFSLRHASAIPPSPPPYIGPHLYTTWNAPEVDRVCALWALRRFVDPLARFHFVEPFSSITHGVPFDTPKAHVRRSATSSVTEQLLLGHGIRLDDRLSFLSHTANLWEVSRWRLPSDREARRFGEELLATMSKCDSSAPLACLSRAFAYLDAWYDAMPPGHAIE